MKGGDGMKQKLVSFMAVVILLGIVTACSGEESVDLEAVEVELSTKPETVIAGSQVDLQALFTGMNVSDKAQATFDFRIGDKPILIEAVNEGDGVFSGSFTFAEKGNQTVFIHLYEEDIHITKKKQVEVQ